ncbi:kinase-like protein [Coprinellus micaceus]|uniref:non-specific serine/threonine protein kinase n=1 Tax=Coprinellus micaceus TaxID=71717 RepID=A0A4Y7TET6_COPMI|nr:kinase-like protein [Coprinellus micaceus]
MAPAAIPNLDFFYPEPGMRLNGGRFELLNHVGSGQYSTAWLAVDLAVSYAFPLAVSSDDLNKCCSSEDLKYAVVKILTRTATVEHRSGRMNELAFHKSIKGDHSVRNVSKVTDDFEVQGPSGPHLCLVFYPLGLDVTSIRKAAPNKALKPHIVQKIICDVLSGLVSLHDRKIIHTDIKSSNILAEGFDNNLACERYLADHSFQIVGEFNLEGEQRFIYAVQSLPTPSPCLWNMSPYDHELYSYCLIDLGYGQWVGQQLTVDVFGPLALRAPEVVIGSNFGPRLDVWAVGCLAFELLVGEWLFNPIGEGDDWTVEADLLAQIFAVTGQRFSPQALSRAQRKDGILDAEGNLLRKKEPPHTSIEERLASANILTEKEVKSAAGFIRKCLTVEYLDRPTSEEAATDDWVFGWECNH